MLIAKHDHQMVEERLAHGRETRVVELRKIDTGDFGADGGGDSADVESNSGHGDGGLLCAAGRCLLRPRRNDIGPMTVCQ